MEVPLESSIPSSGTSESTNGVVSELRSASSAINSVNGALHESADAISSKSNNSYAVANGNTSLPDSTALGGYTTANFQSSVTDTPVVSAIPRFQPSGIPRFIGNRAPPSGMPSTHDRLANGALLHKSEPSSTLSHNPHYPYTSHPSEAVHSDRVMRQTSNVSSASSNSCDRSRLSTTVGQGGISFRHDRTRSQNPYRSQDAMSDNSSTHSVGGAATVITSKVNSLSNVRHKPGGGSVSIVSEKVDFGPIQSKCNSLANVKHVPGGGSVQITQQKLDFTSVHSKVQSLKNVKHVPFGGNVEIYNEALPWLKYNKPNLPPEEKARINKRSTASATDMSSSVTSGSQ